MASQQKAASTSGHDLSLAEQGVARTYTSVANTTSDLRISPAVLRFYLELRTYAFVDIALHNAGEDRVAFQLKTTSPKMYHAVPNRGVVKRGTTSSVRLHLNAYAQQADPGSLAACKDVLVQTMKVNDSVSSVETALFNTVSSISVIKQAELSVVVVDMPKAVTDQVQAVKSPCCPCHLQRRALYRCAATGNG